MLRIHDTWETQDTLYLRLGTRDQQVESLWSFINRLFCIERKVTFEA